MSPIGQAFRNYCRMYPALINNTAIDWFLGWPEDALTEVALKFIGQMGLSPKSTKALLSHAVTLIQPPMTVPFPCKKP